jgi:hypothetical protein
LLSQGIAALGDGGSSLLYEEVGGLLAAIQEE